MTTTKDEKEQSGFECETIGSRIPKGYILVRKANGRWEITKKKKEGRS